MLGGNEVLQGLDEYPWLPGQGPVRIAPVRSQERRRGLSSMRVAGLLALTMGAI